MSNYTENPSTQYSGDLAFLLLTRTYVNIIGIWNTFPTRHILDKSVTKSDSSGIQNEWRLAYYSQNNQIISTVVHLYLGAFINGSLRERGRP